MKRTILTAAALALATTAFSQTTIYETGFESAQEFNEGPLPDTSLNWKQKGTQPFAIVAKDGDAANQIMECQGSNPGANARLWLSGVSFPEGPGKMAIEFEMRLVRSNSQGFQGNVHIGNFPAAPGVKPDGMAVTLSFRGSGRLCTFDGETETEIGNWKDGEWMKFRVEIDSEAKTFLVYQGEDLLAADYAFHDAKATPIRAFGMTYYTGANPGQESSMAIDSVKISKP